MKFFDLSLRYRLLLGNERGDALPRLTTRLTTIAPFGLNMPIPFTRFTFGYSVFFVKRKFRLR